MTPSRTGRGSGKLIADNADCGSHHQDQALTSHKQYSVNFPNSHHLPFPLPAASAPLALNLEGSRAGTGSV
jgi:hypothetical protein